MARASSGRKGDAGRKSSGTEPGEKVSVEWLRDHLDDANVRVIHVSRDRRTYTRWHLPGAPLADLEDEILPRDGNPPDRDRIAASLRRWRVGEGDRIVLYDDRGGDRWAIAAASLLRAHGVPKARVHVLGGGLPAWRKAGGATTAELPEVDLADALRAAVELAGEPDQRALEEYRAAADAVEGDS
ncbi:MAG TPA: rhodanese-like domain-containing protein [Candidatus Limnocylindrales bacterium]|jgi:3-mercaptopyruvate sulfurtransferase SseA